MNSCCTKQLAASLWLTLLAVTCQAHELQDNRLTLVLRDKNHVSLNFFIDYPLALHQAIAPKTPFQEFILTRSAMKPEDFQKELQKAQERFISGTRVELKSGQRLVLNRWQWPKPADVHMLLQQRAMQSLAGDSMHIHATPAEISAEGSSPKAFNVLAIRLPEELGKVLVVSYQPTQTWVERPGATATITF
jgi:hypothetical protein